MSHPHGAAGFVRLSDSTRRCCWCVVVSSPAEFAPFARASAGAVVRRVVASLAILGLMSSAAARAQTPMPPPCEPVAAWTDVGEPAPGYVLWGRAEYLLWWSRPERAPGPLVTTGLPGDPRQGALSNPTTRTLYDGSRLDTHDQSGVRLFLGGWLDAEQTLGVELGGFVLETHTIHGKADSNRTDGAPLIARPFFNTLSGLEDAQIITSPQDPVGGRYLGGIDVFADSRTWGGELNLVRNLQAGDARWDLLVGFRYLGQKDELRFSQSSTVLAPGTVGFRGTAAPAPDIVSLTDFFETNNQFFGGQLGLRGQWTRGPWSLELAGKIGIGDTVQKVSIAGHTLLTNSQGATLTENGGLYAAGSNIGDRTHDRFSFISEASLQVGWQLRPRLRLIAGYDFLFWDDVVRPGRQIDRNIDPRQVPSNLAFSSATATRQPAPLFQASDFWTQGLMVGVEFKY